MNAKFALLASGATGLSLHRDDTMKEETDGHGCSSSGCGKVARFEQARPCRDYFPVDWADTSEVNPCPALMQPYIYFFSNSV